MSASDHLSPQQFVVNRNRDGKSYQFSAQTTDGTYAGMMFLGHTGIVRHIGVHKDFRRQGAATAMWQAAQQAHESGQGPEPRHSRKRSDAGDAWAHSVGGQLPRRVTLPKPSI